MRKIKNENSMTAYHKTGANDKPIDFIPIRIPNGWSVLLNSFCERDRYSFPTKQLCDVKDFDWERDISAYRLKLYKPYIVTPINASAFCSIYVELQEYMDKNRINSLLHIYVYYDLPEKDIFFKKLKSIFCYSIEEAKKNLEEMLRKYKKNVDKILKSREF